MNATTPGPDVQIDEVSPDSDDARYCLDEYFAELASRFDAGFDPAKSLSPTHEQFVPPDGSFIVARLNGSPVACGGFKRDGTDTAYLKRMWVAPRARGLGFGKRILRELEGRAWAAGYRIVHLETQESLKEAQQLYRSSGYREVPPFNDEPYANHWFEKAL